jgi:hypothetical protein
VGVAISGKVCGFGVHYDADSKNLQAYYANTSGPTSLDDDCLETNNVYDGNKTMAEKFIPGNGVSIDSFSEDIFFMSPTGDVYQANSTGGTNLIVDYSIGLTKGSSTSSAAITSGGIIK